MITVLVNISPGAHFPPHPARHTMFFPWVPQLTTYGVEKKGKRVFFHLPIETTVLFVPLHLIQYPPWAYPAIPHSLISRFVKVPFPVEQWFLLFLPGLWAAYAMKREKLEVCLVDSAPKGKKITIIWNPEKEIKIRLGKGIPELEDTTSLTKMKVGCDETKYMNSHHRSSHHVNSLTRHVQSELPPARGTITGGVLKAFKSDWPGFESQPCLLLSVSLIFMSSEVNYLQNGKNNTFFIGLSQRLNGLCT